MNPIRVHEEEMLVASRSFETEVNGEPFKVIANRTRVRADDPLVKAHPEAWRKSGTLPTVEQMTREPGE